MDIEKFSVLFRRVKTEAGLLFFRMYVYDDSYSKENRYVSDNIEHIFKRLKEGRSEERVFISSRFKDKYYPFFDLDDEEKLNTFKDIYNDTPYVIFTSSPDHYWGVVDLPSVNLKDVHKSINWRTCNDDSYVRCQSGKSLFIRGYYENFSRKPQLSSTNGALSTDFKLFINKLVDFYNTTALELSVLMFKNKDLLLRLNRTYKLKKLAEVSE